MRSTAGGALVKFLGETMQPKVFSQALSTWTCQAEQQAVSLAFFLNFIMSLAVFGFCVLLGPGPPCLFLFLKACFGADLNAFMSGCHAKLLHFTAYFNINMTWGGWSKIWWPRHSNSCLLKQSLAVWSLRWYSLVSLFVLRCKTPGKWKFKMEPCRKKNLHRLRPTFAADL